VRRRCILCAAWLDVTSAAETCRECAAIIESLTRRVLEERWRDHPDGVHVVSERGRVARLLKVDRAHRYPRVSIPGAKVYVHHLVAAAWHGPRPDGALVLHHDDDPLNPTAINLRYGDHAENAADRIRNRRHA
jgi:hypothetical protein